MSATIEFATLEAEDVERIAEVDRTEHIEAEYRAAATEDGRGLVLESVALDPAHLYTWTPQGIRARVMAWKPEVQQGGAMFGALADGRLVGFAVVSQRRRDETCELVAIFVDAARRGEGIGGRLYAQAEAAALERHGRALLINSNPTVATVDFYLNRGARVVGMQERSLVPSLNDGIQMAKALAK